METIVRKCVWVVCMVGGVGVGVGCVCMVHMFFDMNRYMQYKAETAVHSFFPFSFLFLSFFLL